MLLVIGGDDVILSIKLAFHKTHCLQVIICSEILKILASLFKLTSILKYKCLFLIIIK